MESLFKISKYGEEREVNLSDEEVEFTKLFFQTFQNSCIETEKLKVVRKSDAYATIVMQGKEWDHDLIRFKFTNLTKWISLSISNEDREVYIDDPLFDAQKKKTQLHWKSKLSGIKELPKYKEIIINSYNQCLDLHKDNFNNLT